MTGRELHQFFDFDMPPYIVILLLLINIVVVVNKCNNASFFAVLGEIISQSKKFSVENMCYVRYYLVILALRINLGPRLVKLQNKLAQWS